MATFPSSLKPQEEYVENIECQVAVTRYPNGTEQRITNGDLLYSFTLKYEMLKGSQLDTLWNFFIARGGKFESFNYTSVRNGQAYVVRFDMTSMSRTLFENTLEKTGLTLIEVKGETPEA
ncbi:MAG: DUF2460 domain-containing protein [Desulfobacteraceae bacterium]|nr:DUF2460 domain-containing protein [Desulfobacteraceae bacterium]